MDFSVQYYVWWLSRITHKCFPVERVYALATQIDAGKANNLDWLFSCVEYVRKHKYKDSIRDARILGREGEQIVANTLIANGWNIIDITDQSLYPRFGSSPITHDIVARFNHNKERYIEVKTFPDDVPFLHITYKQKNKIDTKLSKIKNHFHVFVQNGKILYVRTKDIKYIGYVQSTCNLRYKGDLKFAWVIDPSCLRSFV